MKTSINPIAGFGIALIALVLILALMYRHNFQPTEGSMQTLPPAERAKIMKAYGVGQARPAAPSASSTQPRVNH